MKNKIGISSIFWFFVMTISSYGQCGINGPTTVEMNTAVAYNLNYDCEPSYMDDTDDWDLGSLNSFLNTDRYPNDFEITWYEPGETEVIIGYFIDGDPFDWTTTSIAVLVKPATPDPIIVWNESSSSVDLKQTVSSNPNVSLYWQTTPNGTSKALGTSEILNVTESGTYYLRALYNDGYTISIDIWSTQSASITINFDKTWYLDADGDGYAISTINQRYNPGSGYTQTILPLGDCNDTDPLIHPNTVWYSDTDGDGFGDPNVAITQCTQPDGYVSNASDVCPDYASFENNGCSVFSNENYIHTTTYLNAFSEAQLSTISASDKLENITYFDGLGRPKQQIAIGQSPTGKDIITPILYDAFGRQPKDHLPYVPGDTNNGAFRTGDQEAVLQSYYSGLHPNDFTEGIAASNPFSEKVLEASPLNRVLEQAAQGTDWAVGNGHTIKFDYQTNSTEEVRLFEVALTNTYEPTLIETGFYNSGELYKTITKDENHDGTSTKNHTIEEFKDKQGRVILKRTYASTGSAQVEAHDTYYVYDDFGNLSYVIPPLVNTSDGISNTELAEACYQYQYDARNRLIIKKIPGKDEEYIVYDTSDRPVLTQDANLRANNQWLFTKYDVFGRVVNTGIYTHDNAQDQAQMQGILDAFYTLAVNDPIPNLYEGKVTSGSGYDNSYYSNQSFPVSNIEILTINYFDDYHFDTAGLTLPISVLDQPVTTRTKTLATGSKIKVLNPSPEALEGWITTINAYDEKARPIYTASHNAYLETTDIVKTQLDFVGKVDQSISMHSKTGQDDIVVQDEFTYDHSGRALSHTQAIADSETSLLNAVPENLELDGTSHTDQPISATHSIILKPGFTATPGFHASISPETPNTVAKELISLNSYDELGQLQSKKVGGAVSAELANSAGLQTIDYKYNIRGWLKNINEDTNADNDLFDFSLAYNNPTSGTALFNGKYQSDPLEYAFRKHYPQPC